MAGSRELANPGDIEMGALTATATPVSTEMVTQSGLYSKNAKLAIDEKPSPQLTTDKIDFLLQKGKELNGYLNSLISLYVNQRYLETHSLTNEAESRLTYYNNNY